MNTEYDNHISLHFRSGSNDHDEIHVTVSADNIDDFRLMSLLTKFLNAAGSRITLNL